MPRITDYLDFVIKLLLAFGLIFEMPLFSFFLSRMGLITAQMMRKVRRYAVLCIFIVAAILTPPDVVSQLLMRPLVARRRKRRKRKKGRPAIPLRPTLRPPLPLPKDRTARRSRPLPQLPPRWLP